MSHPKLYLKKNEERRIRRGHVWVFSNEVDTTQTPLGTFAPGDIVDVVDSVGRPLGTAFVNPNSLICARLLSRKPSTDIEAGFFRERIRSALVLRQRLFDRPYYRLVFGESDGLPGMVIDRFDDVLSLQVTTAGMELRIPEIGAALDELLSPRAIVVKNESELRALEGLERYKAILTGQLPDTIEIEENGCRFLVDILEGQKTGWFYDHRSNRGHLATLCRGRRVLDLFAYSGAWGIPAAKAGATAVTCVDASKSALALAAANAKLNGVDEIMAFDKSDVFEFLKAANRTGERYDIVVVDPPALIKRKKDLKQGLEAYARLNRLALRVLSKEGMLVSASCSFHLGSAMLHEILRAGARHVDRHLVFFARGGQAPDHPVHPAIPETDYLKTFFCAVGPSL